MRISVRQTFFKQADGTPDTGRTPPSLEVLCLLCDKLEVGLGISPV